MKRTSILMICMAKYRLNIDEVALMLEVTRAAVAAWRSESRKQEISDASIKLLGYELVSRGHYQSLSSFFDDFSYEPDGYRKLKKSTLPSTSSQKKTC